MFDFKVHFSHENLHCQVHCTREFPSFTFIRLVLVRGLCKMIRNLASLFGGKGWGLGFSSPNPLGQPLRHDDRCVWMIGVPVMCRCCSYYTGELFVSAPKAIRYSVNIASFKKLVERLGHFRARGGTWVFFGWVCAARDSKLVPRSRKNFP